MGGKAGERPRPTPEQSRVTQKPQSDGQTPIKEAGTPPGTGRVSVVSGDSDDEDTEDPMVSDPFVIPVTVRNLHTSLGVSQGALNDSGCTRRAVVQELGVCMMRMRQPIKFEQMDGPMLGGRQQPM